MTTSVSGRHSDSSCIEMKFSLVAVTAKGSGICESLLVSGTESWSSQRWL